MTRAPRALASCRTKSETPPVPSAVRAGLSPAHDTAIARALAKSPGERYGSAQDMAVAIYGWPTEALSPAPGGDPTRTPDGDGGGGAAPHPGPSDRGGAAPHVDIARRADARLVRRRDPRVGRWVLVEERATPLDEATLVRVRALAAAGGPHVQRVLALSEDRCSIVYEAISGMRAGADAPVPIESLSPEEQRALSSALAELHNPGAEAIALGPGARVARTAGGLVVIVAPDLAAAPAAGPLTSGAGSPAGEPCR